MHIYIYIYTVKCNTLPSECAFLLRVCFVEIAQICSECAEPKLSKTCGFPQMNCLDPGKMNRAQGVAGASSVAGAVNGYCGQPRPPEKPAVLRGAKNIQKKQVLEIIL